MFVILICYYNFISLFIIYLTQMLLGNLDSVKQYKDDTLTNFEYKSNIGPSHKTFQKSLGVDRFYRTSDIDTASSGGASYGHYRRASTSNSYVNTPDMQSDGNPFSPK